MGAPDTRGVGKMCDLLNAVCFQLKVKTRVVIGAILFIWIAEPAYMITFMNLSTDIIGETCSPMYAYSSYAVEKALMSLNLVITYLLPLMCMVACYSRIVYRLKTKVTRSGLLYFTSLF